MRTGTATAATQAVNNHSTAVANLPAVNRPPRTRTAAAPTRSSAPSTDQLSALLKYSSRIAGIDDPYHGLGCSINKKGPSATANMKDKSDRATSEQVLDPRTRVILFKMIGRGLIHEVNGCISTGKEVRAPSACPCLPCTSSLRQMYTTR